MAEMPDLIAYQEKQQRQTAAKKPNLMAYQERQEAKKASAAPYNDILVQEARKYGASRARSERSSHRTANHADAERRAQAQVVSDTIRDKKGGMLGGTVNGWLAGQVGAAASGLEALQAADWAVSPEKAIIDASRRNIENYTAKRDAAQTAEERARWQQLIDRNERLIAINSEAYAKKTADVENAVGKLGDTRSKLKSDAEYGIAKEKEGLGAIGRTAVDVGVAGGQMAMDALAGGLPSIATRVFGDSAQEAKETISPDATTAERMEGKTKALAYGAGSAAVSVGTEKLANIAAPFKKVFGNGMFDKAIDGALAKMSGSAAGKAALKAAGSFATEGLEEVVEDALQPILQKATYDENALSQYKDTDYWTNVLYDGLIGGILGLAGSGAEIAGNAVARGESAKFSPQEGAEATRANGEGNLTPDAQNAAEGTQSAEKTAPKEGTAKPNYNILEADAIRREGKTFRNLVAGFDTSVSAFFDKWSGGRKNGQGEKLEKLYLGMLTDAQRKAVSDILGYPVSERNVIVTNDDVRHILREHGSPEAELRKGNLPLERWAIDALPEVVTQPDSITPGEVQVGGKNDGKRGVLLSKSMPDGKVITVQFDNKGRGTMEITTMYVKENSGDFTQTLNVEEASPQLTAEPVSGPVSPAIENSISSNGENVKRGMIEPRTLYIRKRTPQDTVSNTETTSALNSNVRNVPPQEFSSADSVAHGFDPVNTQDMRSAREYAPERHIDNRTSESVGARDVNAFQFDHPEMRPYYTEAAEQLSGIAGLSLHYGQQMGGRERTANGYRRASYIFETPALRQAMDEGLTRGQIIDAADRLIRDHGQENVKAAKVLELVLDDMLTNGYTAVDGSTVGPNPDYIAAKSAINGAQPVTERTAEELPIWDVDGLGGANRGSLNSDFQNMQERSDEFHRVNRTAEERTAELHGRAPSEVPTVNPATGKAVSKAVSTILNSPVTSNEFAEVIEQAVAGGTFDYLPITDKAAHTAAQDAIRRAGGYQTVADEFNVLASLGQSVGKENMARGIAAYNEAVAAGDHVTAFELLTNIAQSAHTSAQTVQAMNLLNRLTPAGKLLSLRRYVDSVNRKAQERGTGRRRRAADAETVQTNFVDQYDGIFIDPELADAYLTAESDAGRKAAWDAITQSIADQSPSTFREKADAWRYLSMLGNPTTHVRNLAGNAIQLGARTVKNTIGALIEPMVVRDSSQRTKSVVGRSGADAKLRQWAKEQYAADQQSAMGGGKYSEYNASGIAREIEEKRRAQVFGKSGVGKAVNAASRWNTAALDRGDVLFNRPAYVESFAQALKAKGVTAEEAQSGAKPELVAAAREYAINEAQKATYRNTTDLSELLARAGHYQGDNKAAKALSIAYDAVMPFRKTPANILTTGLDYSPIGIAKAVKQAAVDVKSGKATAADAVDSLCEGLTGTGILALGAYLASEGLLNLRAGDDDDEEAFNKTLGHQDYALELGGRSYTLDWAVPAAIPLFAGAALVEGGMDFGGLMDAVSNIGDVVLETSMLSTFNDIIRNISYADNPMASAVGRVASSYASQFLPTVGGKIASALDDTVRKSYVESGTSQLERDAKHFGQTVLRKTPFAREAMQPSIDMWGEEVSNGDPLLRIIQNSVSPSTVKEIKNDAVTQEVWRLYEATGEGLPSAAEKSFVVNGERKYLTGEEYTEYAKVMGQTRRQVLEPLLKSKGYQKLSDADKAKAVGYAYEYAKVKGKQAVSDYKVSDSSVAKGMMQSVMPPETYILYKVNADRDDNTRVDYVESAQTLLELSGMTNAQRGKAWQEKNSTTNAAKNPFTGALAEAGVSPRTAVKVLDKYRTLNNADGKAKDKTAEFQQYLHELGFDAAQMAAARDTFSFYTSVPAKWK